MALFKTLVRTNPVAPKALSDLMSKLGMPSSKGEGDTINDRILQRTRVFKERPKVVLVADLQKKVPALKYSDLPNFSLNDDEATVISNIEKTLRFNGDNILLSDGEYDEENNTLYLEAVCAPYSVIRALAGKKITRDQFYFKTGVMTPLVCEDKKVVFLERSDAAKLFSAPGGFLQPVDQEGALMMNFNGAAQDLVLMTALKELKEELLHDTLAGIAVLPRTGFSLRYDVDASLPTAEFIVPIKVPFIAQALTDRVHANHAEDAAEHTGGFWIFDYSDAEAMRASLQEMAGADRPGWFLYLPMLEVMFPELGDKIRTMAEEFSQEQTAGPAP